MTIGFWTPEKVSTLEERWLAGYTSAEIGAEIGASKNAVIGKARRLGLPSRLQEDFVQRGRAYKRDASLPPPSAPTKIERPVKAKTIKKRLSETPLPPEKEPVFKTVMEAVLELKSGACRWPYGEPHQNKLAFCGEPTFEKYPYCLRHCYHSYANFEEIQAKKAEKNEHRR